MSESRLFSLHEVKDTGLRAPNPDQGQQRAVGSPLPVGAGSSSRMSGLQGDAPDLGTGSPTPGRALAKASSASQGDAPSGLQWAVNALRGVLPFAQKILPLLDGNFGTAVSNILTPHPPAPPPSPPVNLAPLEGAVSELQTQHRDLRSQIVEQNTSLKRVEDKLEMVREATDRNTLEQQELLEDLKKVGNKIKIFASIALALLAVSIVLNVILYLHIERVLP